jgi:hypothetical protein
MAVGADEFALVDLLEHAPPIVATGQVSNVGALRAPRKMVPLHCLRRKRLTAVNARASGLEIPTPSDECAVALAFLLDSPRLDALVILRVVRSSAHLAPGLATVAAAMKLAVRLLLATSAAPLHSCEATVWSGGIPLFARDS